jgi:hypothetical protein
MNRRFWPNIHGAQVGKDYCSLLDNLTKIIVITIAIKWGPVRQRHSLILPDEASTLGSNLRCSFAS